jgi:hypothetical protein
MRRRPFATLARAAWFWLSLLLGAQARAAQPPPDATAAPIPSAPAGAAATERTPPLVEIAIVGDVPSSGALGARIVSWFHGAEGHAHAKAEKSLDSSTVFAPSANPGVRVWVVPESASNVRLFFAVEEHPDQVPRYLVNDVALDTGLDELGMEQLAQVVYLSAMALWSGNVESSRSEVEAGLRQTPTAEPKVSPAQATPVVARRRWSARLGLEALGRGGVTDGIFLRGGLSLGVFQKSERSILGGQLHADLSLPDTVEKLGIELKFSSASFRLGVLSETRIAAKSWASFELGPGVDIVHYRATALDSSLRATGGGLDVRPTIYGSICTRFSLGALSLEAGPLLVVELERVHYDIAGPSGRSEILVPWLVQPGVTFGLYW